MSYNISAIKLKTVDGFKFDIDEIKSKFFDYFENLDGDEVKVSTEGEKTTICFFGGPEIEGALEEQWLQPSEIWLTGEWSGTIWREVIVPSMPKTTGKLDAVLIWEGGDYIERVTVDNGKYHEEEY